MLINSQALRFEEALRLELMLHLLAFSGCAGEVTMMLEDCGIMIADEFRQGFEVA